MNIEFNRLNLYEEVWTTPPTQLARKYGLSDNGFQGRAQEGASAFWRCAQSRGNIH
jgi:hypothetical protein